MTLEQIFHIITKHLVLILVVTLIGAAAAGVISWFFMDDVYQASSTIIVSSQKATNSSDKLTYSDYTLNVQLVNSYRVLCKTDRVLKQVIEQLKLPMSTGLLASKITVTSEDDTEIIRLSVRDKEPARAQQIANTLATVFQSEVVVIMKMDNVQIIDTAQMPGGPVEPNRTRNLLLGILAGVVIGIGLSLLLEYLDRSVRSEGQVVEILDVPVLGVIPHIDNI